MSSESIATRRRLVRLLAFASLFLVASGAGESVPYAAASQPVAADGFNVLSAAWGTPTVPAYPGPGNQNVPLTVTLQYYYYNVANAAQASLDLSSGFTDYSGSSSAVAYVTSSLTSGTVLTLTFYLNIAPGAALGAYTFPMSISWGVTLMSGNYVISSVSLVQSASLTVYLRGAPKLNFAAVQQSLVPARQNDVTFVLSNQGSGPATSLSTTVSASTGPSVSSQSASVLGSFPAVASLAPGSNVTSTMSVFVPSSAAGSPLTFAFTADYTDSYGTSKVFTQSVGVYVTNSPPTTASLSVTVLNGTLTAGQATTVRFAVRNVGSAAVYGPAFSISVSSPLFVVSNSTMALPASASIDPGASVTYSAVLSSTASASAGGNYPGTISATYQDGSGLTQSQSLPVSFTLLNPVYQVSASVLSSEVSIGGTTPVSLLVSNTGTSTIYSPTVALSVPAPLAVTANSTLSQTGLAMEPGGAFRFTASVTDGPKTPEGAYSGTLTVGYRDAFGNQYSATFPVGIVVVGSIVLVIQDEVVQQTNASSVSVSGTLLNEGASPAYYTQVAASITMGGSTLGNSTAYVGEVDPNTPVPFSVSVPISPGTPAGSGSVALSLAYKNDFGRALSLGGIPSASVSLDSALLASQAAAAAAAGQRGQGLGQYLDALLVLAVVLLVVAALFVRRRRRRKAGAKRSVI